MNIIQTLRRIGQKMSGWDSVFQAQKYQIELMEKLYQKNGLQIKMTCSAMPEQYEVFKDGEQIAYYRLRHGYFRVDIPDCGGEMIFEAEPNGDDAFNADERLVYLTKAMIEVIKKLNNHQ